MVQVMVWQLRYHPSAFIRKKHTLILKLFHCSSSQTKREVFWKRHVKALEYIETWILDVNQAMSLRDVNVFMLMVYFPLHAIKLLVMDFL